MKKFFAMFFLVSFFPLSVPKEITPYSHDMEAVETLEQMWGQYEKATALLNESFNPTESSSETLEKGFQIFNYFLYDEPTQRWYTVYEKP
jgi:hypothetical protein